MPYPFSTPTVTISSGGSLSPAFMVGDGDIMAVTVPSTWTSAVVTFQVSTDGVTFKDLYDQDGNEVTATVVAGKTTAITGRSLPYAKVRSGTNGSPVNQASDAAVTVHVRKRAAFGL